MQACRLHTQCAGCAGCALDASIGRETVSAAALIYSDTGLHSYNWVLNGQQGLSARVGRCARGCRPVPRALCAPGPTRVTTPGALATYPVRSALLVSVVWHPQGLISAVPDSQNHRLRISSGRVQAALARPYLVTTALAPSDEGVRVLRLAEEDETARQSCGVEQGREGERVAVCQKMTVRKAREGV